MTKLKAERASLPEKFAAAVGSAHLEQRAHEMPIDRIGAMGAARLHVAHGADYRREPVAATLQRHDHAPRPEDELAAELGSLLLRLRDGRQAGELQRAIHTFGQWMAYRGRVARFEDAPALLPRLAALALHEFCSGLCPRCGGTGQQFVTASGALVSGGSMAAMARNARFRHCPAKNGCGGSGRALPSHTLRREALGLTLERYEAERWGEIVQAALAWLHRLARRIQRPLGTQLRG